MSIKMRAGVVLASLVSLLALSVPASAIPDPGEPRGSEVVYGYCADPHDGDFGSADAAEYWLINCEKSVSPSDTPSPVYTPERHGGI